MKKKNSLKLKKCIMSVFFGMLCFVVIAQNIDVSGTVVDENGDPLVGVTIQLQGTAVGTITDIDGIFTLSNIAPNAILEVSYVGMKNQVVNLNGRRKLDIILLDDAEVLSEVVVTGFGLAQRKESLTSAIAVIGAEDIKRSKSSTSSGALVGKIAGVNSRQPDGRPGAGTAIQIRNMGTPLYVIDGIQSDEGQFNNIDFNDIESISILKDASASIYGVRAANGVVVVTTKKGIRDTKNTVTFNAYYG